MSHAAKYLLTNNLNLCSKSQSMEYRRMMDVCSRNWESYVIQTVVAAEGKVEPVAVNVQFRFSTQEEVVFE